MNQLNSIILEGNAKTIDLNSDYTTLTIGVSRFTKNTEGELKENVCVFQLRCFGIVAECAKQKFKENRKLRVVGRLSQEGSAVFVVAEHLEWCAVPKTAKVENNGQTPAADVSA